MLLRLLRLGMLVAAGAGAYFGILLLLGFRPRDFARRAIH
jgi:putative peptidoglycan lipid II flippase